MPRLTGRFNGEERKMGNNQYVVLTRGPWGARGECKSRLTARYKSQAAPVGRGRVIAQKQKAELRIQGRGSRFGEGWS
jgi:hypothetical protein